MRQPTLGSSMPHKHLSLKVPNIELDFDACAKTLMLAFWRNWADMSKPNVEQSLIIACKREPKMEFDFDVSVGWPISALMSKT